MCHYNRNTLFAFSRAERVEQFLWAINHNCHMQWASESYDLISNIVSKNHGNFTENFTIFFSDGGKTGIVAEFKFDIF